MRGRRVVVLNALKKYSRRNINETRLLDFGCGSGYFMGQLAEMGYWSFGLDNSAEAIQFGREQGIKNLAVAGSNRINFPSDYFDCVLLLDVLEHLENESPIIEEVERVLSPGGIVVITVPAFKFLWGVQDKVSHHYRRYRMPQLLDIVQRSGNFNVVFKSYFNTFLFAPIAAVRLFSRWLKIKGRQSDFDINNKFLNWFFGKIFSLEIALLKRIKYPFGVSIALVLKKNA